jgi:hypothetical protein
VRAASGLNSQQRWTGCRFRKFPFDNAGVKTSSDLGKQPLRKEIRFPFAPPI